MTRLLIAYDASESARASIGAAAALFPGAEAVVATVHRPSPTVEAAAMARIALPDHVIREGVERMHSDVDRHARETATEGAADIARTAGLKAEPAVLQDTSTWRALVDEARRIEADVLVCGTRGAGAVGRVLVGSTASTLLHHTEIPLLVVPADVASLDGPIVAGYDDSDGARNALRFAAAHLSQRRMVVAHAWRSPVRHSVRGHAFAGSHIDAFEEHAETLDATWAEIAESTAAEGATYARELGLTAEPSTPESAHGGWQTVLEGARAAGAAAILVGTRGRGAVTATVLGSVASGLVHAAELPVLVVPPADD